MRYALSHFTHSSLPKRTTRFLITVCPGQCTPSRGRHFCYTKGKCDTAGAAGSYPLTQDPRPSAAGSPLPPCSPLCTDTASLGNFSTVGSQTRAGRSWQELEAEPRWPTALAAAPAHRPRSQAAAPPASHPPGLWSISDISQPATEGAAKTNKGESNSNSNSGLR